MASQTAVDREILTWSRFGDATIELAEQVAASGYRPDIVLAVARGGLTVAGALAYALSVKNCFAMNVEFYTGVDQRLDVPVVLPPTLDVVDITGLQVLVADRPQRDPSPRGRRPLRRAVPEGALDRGLRVRVAAHRLVDQLPLVVSAPGGRWSDDRRLSPVPPSRVRTPWDGR